MTQVQLDEKSRALEDVQGRLHRIAPDLAYIRTAIVNVIFQGSGDDWVLA